MTGLTSHLTFLYGEEGASRTLARIQDLAAEYRTRIQTRDGGLTEQDAILITYADQIQSTDEKPLRTLRSFCRQHLDQVVNGIHILPFFPWTSDDGFSVMDFRRVDPALGGWEDISALRDHFKLMFDCVINHISSQSEWFQAFLREDPNHQDYFIRVENDPDLSQVVRPRALPLLTSFSTSAGNKQVWTTFSADQIDLNYQNPQVLLEMLDILLMYVERGASFIRLDAIAYVWKEIGTSCIHLPQTHRLVQLLRTVLDQAAPHVQLITETNVPHADNLSYFGDGTNEAQLIYNFALPPLVLHTFRTGEAGRLSEWAAGLALPSRQTTFFNFLASHDGIGLNPARGILAPAEIEALVEAALVHGGLISHKHNPDGTRSPYEMNLNFFDALSNPQGDDPLERQIDRFITSQAIMLSLVGVPGIYFHSLFGSRGWPQGVQQTGRNRTINREKCSLDVLQRELGKPDSLRARVFGRYRDLLTARRSSSAFHPHGSQKVLNLNPSVFAIERISPAGDSVVLCLHNVSAHPIQMDTPMNSGTDLLRHQTIQGASVRLDPYQVLWIRP